MYKESKSLKKVSNYYIDMNDILGKGQYSTVYKGVDSNNGKPIAVKIIQSQTNQYVLDAIHKEIKNLQLIDNEYVVRLQDVKQSVSNYYLIMEYCNGGSLQTLMSKNQGRLSEEDALKYFRHVIEGMKELYVNGMVHRDLKPANILLHNQMAKIADFGFSKLVDANHPELYSIVGSPLYMSPQLLEGSTYTNLTDIWSLGVILYQMLYGKSPFNGDSKSEILKQIKESKIYFPEYPNVSHLTKQLIQMMLQQEESQRITWVSIFNHEIMRNPDEKFKESLGSILSSCEQDDRVKKAKEISKIYFKQNKVITSSFECRQKYLINCTVMKQFVKHKEDDVEQLMNSVIDFQKNKTIDSIYQEDIGKLIEQNKCEQQQFEIFTQISQLLLNRRNKAVFFYLSGIQLYELLFEESDLDDLDKDLVIRTIFLVIKYSFVKLYKIYKKLKNYSVVNISKFSPKAFELYLKSDQRTYLLQFLSFDFEMCQIFYNAFMKYTIAYLNNLNQKSSEQSDKQSTEVDDFILTNEPPLFFNDNSFFGNNTQDDFFFELDKNKLSTEKEQMIAVFLKHCNKKLQQKDQFQQLIQSTVQLITLQIEDIKDSNRRILLPFMKIRFICNDWKNHIKSHNGSEFWGKFYQSLNNQTKEQIIYRLLGYNN